MNPETTVTSDVVGLTKPAPFSRRGFMTASAALAAGYTLATGPVRADVVKTDTTGLDAGDTKIEVSDGDMPDYYARPAGVSNPPVIVVAMEIFGLQEYIKDVTRRLAKLGALAVAPDYYFRKGVDLTKISEIKDLLPIVNSKPDAELLSDLDATVAWAKSQGGDTARLGIIGFCRGGRTVWEYAAHSGTLKAGAAFYGAPIDPPSSLWPKSPMQLAPEMKAPVLGLYGGADWHSGRAGGAAEGDARSQQEGCRVQGLPRRAARLPRRLSHELPQGSCGRCLEPDAGLVQETWRAELEAGCGCKRRAGPSRLILGINPDRLPSPRAAAQDLSRRMRKLIEFDDDTFDKLKQLARDRMGTLQELADEAFADLLKKHGIPIDLKDALRKSARLDETAKSGGRPKPAKKRRA